MFNTHPPKKLKEVSGLKNSQGCDYISSKILKASAPLVSSPLNYT
jgi:hypothetical protein